MALAGSWPCSLNCRLSKTKNGEPCIVFHTVFGTSGMRSKTYHEMCNALMNTEVRGMHMSVKELVGKSCRITIVHNDLPMAHKPTRISQASSRSKTCGNGDPRGANRASVLLARSARRSDVVAFDAGLEKLSKGEREKV